MVVVAVLGILIVIAVPNYITMRDSANRNLCVQNLQLLKHVVEQYAIEYNSSTGTAPTDSIIWGTSTSFIKEKLQCPMGASYYTVPNVGSDPVCPEAGSYPEHVLS